MPPLFPNLSALASVLPVGAPPKRGRDGEPDGDEPNKQPGSEYTRNLRDYYERVKTVTAKITWSREFDLDTKMLRGELARAFDPDSTEFLSDPEKLELSLLTCYRGKLSNMASSGNADHDLMPLSIAPRPCATSAKQRLPLGISDAEFVRLVEALDSIDGIDYIFSAMPVDPVQRQYKAIAEDRPCVLVHYGVKSDSPLAGRTAGDTETAIVDRILIDIPRESIQTNRFKGCFVRNDELCERMRQMRQSNAFVVAKAGSSNYGSKATAEEFKELENANLFKVLGEKCMLPGDTDRVHKMAQRTGIWVRRNMERLDPRVRHEVIYETYYTLRGAVIGVSMPVYAFDICTHSDMHVYFEQAYCALDGPGRENREQAITSFVDDLDWVAKPNPFSRKPEERRPIVSRFLAYRFASCMLALAEVGLLLTDAKPDNFLFQKSYSPLEPGNATLDVYPACVMATDIDSKYSFFFRVGGTAPEVGPVPIVDTQCVRFCNTALFTILPLCHGEIHITEVARDDILSLCRLYVRRFKSEAVLCSTLDSIVTLKQAGESYADKTPNALKKMIVNRASGRNPTMTWETFVTGLALLIVSQAWHYGLRHIISIGGNQMPYRCPGPLKFTSRFRDVLAAGTDTSSVDKLVFGEVLRWMIYETGNLTRTPQQSASNPSGTTPMQDSESSSESSERGELIFVPSGEKTPRNPNSTDPSELPNPPSARGSLLPDVAPMPDLSYGSE